MKKRYQILIHSISIAVAILLCGQIGLAQRAASTNADKQTLKIFSMPIENLPQPNLQPTNTTSLSSTVPQSFCGTRFNKIHKLKYGLEQAFLNPTTYIFPAFTSIRQQMGENSSHKSTGDNFADGLSRFAINYGISSSKALFTSGIYPIIFKQNPHYEPSHKSSIAGRILYAASRVFVTCGDNGNQQFNSSRIAGALTASALANLWERSTPGHDRIGVSPTFRRFGYMVGLDVVKTIVLKEFGPGIKRKLLRR